MATISATAQNTGLMYKFAANSLNGNTSNSSMAGLIGGLSSSSSTSAWSNITNAASSGLAYATAVASNRTSLSSLLSEYDSTKKQFLNEYDSAFSDLSKAAKALKTTDFSASETTTSSTGEDTDSETKNTPAAVGAVQDFVNAYNGAISFLSNNKEVSNRVSALSGSFNDASYFSGSLSKVGISVKSGGQLSVDTDKLTQALEENPKAAEAILGKGGFAERTANKVENAQRQRDKMFPSVSSMMGSSVSEAKRMYSGNTVNRSMAYENLGTLLNMYF